MKKYQSFFLITTAILILSGCAQNIRMNNGYNYTSMDRITRKVHKKAETFLFNTLNNHYTFTFDEEIKIQSVHVDRNRKKITIDFSPELSFIPMRQDVHDQIYIELKKSLGWKFRRFSLEIRSLEHPISDLIPNLYRDSFDKSRIPLRESVVPHITNLSKPLDQISGLQGSHLAVWHSHGWYYNNEIDRWEWMRPRLFQTVEDLLPMSFTIPYLFPMLENSGANLYVPKERDLQSEEVICDIDSDTSHVIETGLWSQSNSPGFSVGSLPYKSNENPFQQGRYRFTNANTMTTATVAWTPDIPSTGNYSVYIAYGKSDSAVTDAKYTVHHAGGSTKYSVNQQMGFGTWVYLGSFKFFKGVHTKTGRVELTNQSNELEGIISADAVRFGGGIGNIVRGESTSGRPRYQESSRYFLQYTGMPDSLYNVHADTNDYKDDYQRGEWVNYLKGDPYGPNTNRDFDGLNIPIDLAVAFHTDAGIEKDQSVGTLAIYRLIDDLGFEIFPDSSSRLANRDLADLIQTQIVDDVRKKYDDNWNRRKLWDADYRSARTPNVPTVLLELLSHQNFYDMQFALDPQFRFDVSRSIYKGILKYITNSEQRPYIVQPLPVDHFAIEFRDSSKIKLSWKPVLDPLEPSAVPDKYIVYTRKNDGGFDNGTLVDTGDSLILDITPEVIHSFKITAVNDGGESFPSEILSVCLNADHHKDTVLIVNGFDRVSGPAIISQNGFEGFLNLSDEGVPDKYDLNFTGEQFNFSPESPWTTNDLPGHGASHADLETKVIPGNTFDFVYTHGVSIKNAGYSFISMSDEAAESAVDLSQFNIIDLILGEEQTTYAALDSSTRFEVLSDKMRYQLTQYCLNGGNLFISGAHIGTDLFAGKPESHPDILFARHVLKFNWAADHSSKSGNIFGVGFASDLGHMKFNQGYHPAIYKVESPDALDPIPGFSTSLLRYSDNHFGAGTVYNGSYNTVVLGFPFETVISQADRDKLMKVVLKTVLSKIN